MTYNEKLAERVRNTLAGLKGLTEKKMFGGISFMLNGKMCCGVVKEDLVVRVGPERYEEALAEPYVRPMDFTGRPLRGFVFVSPPGYQTNEALANWVGRAAHFVTSLSKK